MKSEQFIYWLQGFMEMENPKTLNLKQTKMIKDHLALVFNKKTPNRNKVGKFNSFVDLNNKKIC